MITPQDSEWEPAAERTISDVETLRALSDPVRLRILETMVARAADAWTVKRLAERLGVRPTSLYHHIGVLEQHGLIRVAATRVVSGIIETSYRVAQLSLQVDRRLLAGGMPEAVEELLRSVLDTVREGVATSLATGLADPDPAAEAPRRLILARGLARVRPERAGDLHERMRALIAEFDALDEGPDGVSFGYIVGLYPIADASAGPSEDGDD